LLPVISAHFVENRVILLQTIAKCRCIKLCAIFSVPAQRAKPFSCLIVAARSLLTELLVVTVKLLVAGNWLAASTVQSV